MPQNTTEHLLYGGEPPQCRAAYEQYLLLVRRGKSLLQLKAVADALTADLRLRWSPRSFTRVVTSAGTFDEVVCNVSYHFHKHGQKYGTVRRMTDAALRMFRENRAGATVRKTDGLLRFPDGSLFEPDGRIVTFVAARG